MLWDAEYDLTNTDAGYITHADMQRVLSVTSAARKRSIQLSTKQLNSLVAAAPAGPGAIIRQSSDSVAYGKVAPAPAGGDGDRYVKRCAMMRRADERTYSQSC